MKITGWIAGALVAGGVVLAMRGCLSKPAPDERIAKRLAATCEIMRTNVASPERGVRKLGHYASEHVGEILGDWGETVAMIEQISDDTKHDARARLARDRIRGPINACSRDVMAFTEAVKRDPKASALLEQTMERVGRTLEIIFGTRLDGRALPSEIDHLITNL